MTLSTGPWWWAPVFALGWITTVPAQSFSAPARAWVMAAARFMPGVCGVLMSSSLECTTRTPWYFHFGSGALDRVRSEQAVDWAGLLLHVRADARLPLGDPMKIARSVLVAAAFALACGGAYAADNNKDKENAAHKGFNDMDKNADGKLTREEAKGNNELLKRWKSA